MVMMMMMMMMMIVSYTADINSDWRP